MKVIQYPEAPVHVFDSHPAKGVTGRVVIGKDDGAGNFCMRIFELAPGGHTPCHTHAWEHEIFVHAGKGQVLRNGAWEDIEKANVVFIPGNEEHQFRNTGGQHPCLCLPHSRRSTGNLSRGKQKPISQWIPSHWGLPILSIFK